MARKAKPPILWPGATAPYIAFFVPNTNTAGEWILDCWIETRPRIATEKE